MPVSVSTWRSFSERPSAGEPGCTIVSAPVSSVSSRAICTTGCSGSPCSTYHVMSRAASQIDSDALASRIRPRSSSTLRASGAARRTQDSSSSSRTSRAGLEDADLGRERSVVEQDRGVGEPDRGLAQVLHLDEDVDRAVQLRQGRRVVVRRLRERRRAGDLADEVHAFLGSADQEHVARDDDHVGARVELPARVRADRHHPHAGLGRQRQFAERLPDRLRAVADPDPRRHLVRVAQVAAQHVGDPEPRGDDARDVRRRRCRRSGSRRRSTGRPPSPRRPRGCARRASRSCGAAGGGRSSARRGARPRPPASPR